MNVQQLKKPLLYTTVGLFAASALIGIIVVLTSTFSILIGQIISTTSILGLLALFSMNNILRTENEHTYIKVLSIIALIGNLAWCIPWLLIVWDIIDYSGITLWRITYTAIIVAFNATLAAKFLSFKKYTQLIKGLSIMTIVTSAIISIYILVTLYSSQYTIINQFFDSTWRVLVISGILLVFGIIVTPILARSAAKKEIASENESNETELRAQIEKEVRAKVEAEMREKIANDRIAQPTSELNSQTEQSTPEQSSKTAHPTLEQNDRAMQPAPEQSVQTPEQSSQDTQLGSEQE